MGKLIIFNLILIAIIALGLWLVKKYVKKERAQNIILIVAAIFTIVFHYSSFIFKLLSGGNAIEYLGETPNLILPIYPCNVVMWSALIFAFLKNKKSSPSNGECIKNIELTSYAAASDTRAWKTRLQ